MQRIREELLQVVVDDVSASLQIFHPFQLYRPISISAMLELVSEMVVLASVMALPLQLPSGISSRPACVA